MACGVGGGQNFYGENLLVSWISGRLAESLTAYLASSLLFVGCASCQWAMNVAVASAIKLFQSPFMFAFGHCIDLV